MMNIEKSHDKLQSQIKVSIENGYVNIEHSDKYNDLEARYYSGEEFTKKQRRANYKFIEDEEAQIDLARKSPEAFIKKLEEERNQSKNHETTTPSGVVEDNRSVSSKPSEDAFKTSYPEKGANAVKQEVVTTLEVLGDVELAKLSKSERHHRAEKAFSNASPEDAAAANENLTKLEAELKKSTAKLPHNIASAVVGAGLEEGLLTQGELLIQIASNKSKQMPVTNDLANFVQDEDKNLLTNTIATTSGNGFSNSTTLLHGTGSVPILGKTSLGLTSTVDSEGNLSAGGLARAAQRVYKEGSHEVYLGEELAIGGSNLLNESKLNLSITPLIANTHSVAGKPTTEIISHTINPLTGQNTTGLSLDVIPNPESKNHLDLRAYGNYGHENKQFSAGGEIYYKINEAAKLYAGGGVDGIGTKQEGYNVHSGLQVQF